MNKTTFLQAMKAAANPKTKRTQKIKALLTQLDILEKAEAKLKQKENR